MRHPPRFFRGFRQSARQHGEPVSLEDTGNGWLQRGLTALREPDYPTALHCFEQAVKELPDVHAVWYGRGVSLYYAHQDEAATGVNKILQASR